MSTQQQENTIVPPVIIDEHGDVEAYESVQLAIRDVEAVDVLNDEYAFYDSTGQILRPHVSRQNVSLTPTGKMAEKLDVLRGRILNTLRTIGHNTENLSEVPLDRLARLTLEEAKKHAASHSFLKDLWHALYTGLFRKGGD